MTSIAAWRWVTTAPPTTPFRWIPDGAVGAGRAGFNPIRQRRHQHDLGRDCAPPTAIPRHSICNTWKLATRLAASYYDQRYALFYNAIKSNYPAIHLIAPRLGRHSVQRAGGNRGPALLSKAPARSFPTRRCMTVTAAAARKYFVGEYAVTSDTWQLTATLPAPLWARRRS